MNCSDLTNKESECVKNMNKYVELMNDAQDKITLFERKIEEHTLSIKEINFDIEVIEDPVSRPLGTGQENRRIEMLIRELESKVKLLESKIHHNQCQIIKYQILSEQYEAKIVFEQNNLVKLVADFRKKIESKYNTTDYKDNITKI